QRNIGQVSTSLCEPYLTTFKVELFGVLNNTIPSRDIVLCRLSGSDLEKTGVIAGMSGSPVYIDGKLLGAVAFAWPFGKEPLAGVTPFCQMHAFVESLERRDRGENSKAEIPKAKNKEAANETRIQHANLTDVPAGCILS